MTQPSAALVGVVYGQVTTALSGLEVVDLARPTRAAGWSVADLTFHLLLDAQRVLVTLATPAAGPVDTDAVTYWRGFRPGVDPDGDAAHAEYVRRSAAAYRGTYGLVRHWGDTAAAAVRAAASPSVPDRVSTQGHVLMAGDFLSTIVVEAAIHYLDLTVALDAAPLDVEAADHTVGVLVALLGRSFPDHWSATDVLLKGTGREPLTSTDRTALGDHHDRLPLLG